jgi:hypothetical protein
MPAPRLIGPHPSGASMAAQNKNGCVVPYATLGAYASCRDTLQAVLDTSSCFKPRDWREGAAGTTILYRLQTTAGPYPFTEDYGPDGAGGGWAPLQHARAAGPLGDYGPAGVAVDSDHHSDSSNSWTTTMVPLPGDIIDAEGGKADHRRRPVELPRLARRKGCCAAYDKRSID